MNSPIGSKINYIELVEPLGSGGTAEVYKGVDLNSGSLVAVKVLSSNLFKSVGIREKLKEEANHYLYLNHPGIVRLKDFIIRDEAYYLVMEYIDGQNLEKYISKTTGPLPEPMAINLMKEILDAIGYAHNSNVLHLDIKPSNIMLDQKGKIKILDFGISAELSENIQSIDLGAPIGTPYYMSPEQTKGSGIDHRSDIYSLGITFFQMLTGTVPFSDENSRDAVYKKINAGNLKKAKEFYPFVSEKIQAIIDTATAVNKVNRFNSTQEFKNALTKITI